MMKKSISSVIIWIIFLIIIIIDIAILIIITKSCIFTGKFKSDDLNLFTDVSNTLLVKLFHIGTTLVEKKKGLLR